MQLNEEGAGAFWNGARHYIELRGYVGGAYNQGGLVALLALGVNNNSNNTFSTQFYQGRVAFTSSVNWQTLNTEVPAPALELRRAVGWHNLKAVISPVDIQFFIDDILAHVIPRTNNAPFDSIALGADLTANGHTAWVDNVKVSTIEVPTTAVVGGFVYHNGWAGDGSPIDAGKSLHKEGATPTDLTYDNLINTAKGINGAGFDVDGLANAAGITEDDFEFQVSPQGAFDQGANPPAGWAAAPAPTSVTVTPGSPDQILILWDDSTIVNRWLRITVKATANTGLAEDEVYYIGHLTGETSGLSEGIYTVAFLDISPIRAGIGAIVDSSSILDIDKNGTVNFSDISAMRASVGAQLSNITVPAAP